MERPGMIPSAPESAGYDGVLIEIRSGRGGEDAEVFAAELLQMYRGYAQSQSWETETLLREGSGDRRVKVALLKVIGEGAYKRLRHETGRHRVQRVPESERWGRIHTSTASVVVMPVPDEWSRAEVIRTYNFPDDEARDHPHKVKVSGARRVLGGELGLILDKLEDSG
jgi:protein subunit release factor A